MIIVLNININKLESKVKLSVVIQLIMHDF